MTRSSQKLVTIIMPAYNASRYIAEAIQSVVSQNYILWELIIVDDGSTDDTLKVALNFAKTDYRIKILPMVHQGSPAIARNAGLINANGEMIAFLDADDRFEESALSTMLSAFTSDEITAVYGFANTIDATGQLKEPLVALKKTYKNTLTLPNGFSQTWEDIVKGQIQCLLSALMLRKSTLQRVGLLDERWVAGEDYQFFVRLYLDSFEGVKAIPAYIYQYRIYADSLTKTQEKAKKVMLDNLDIVEWLFNCKRLPASVAHLKSVAIAEAYRYLMRERLLHAQPQLTLWMGWEAFNNPVLEKNDWTVLLLPLMLRALMGTRLNYVMLNFKKQLKDFEASFMYALKWSFFKDVVEA